MQKLKMVVLLLMLISLIGCSSNTSSVATDRSSADSSDSSISGNSNISSSEILSSSPTSNSEANNSESEEKTNAINPKQEVSSQIPKFDPKDIYIDGTISRDDSGKKYFVLSVNNMSSCYDLNGIMIQTAVKNLPNYNTSGIKGGTVNIEKGIYVWRFPQTLAHRCGENVTIECTAGSGNICPFDFYTYGGKTQIGTCQIVT